MKRPNHVMIAFRCPDLASQVTSRFAGLSGPMQDCLVKTSVLRRSDQ